MLNLEELKNKKDIINSLDWDMTPEEAVRLYLEWGNNWVHDKYVIRHDSDISLYFMVYSWEGPPVIYLVRRNMKGAEELAKIDMPVNVRERFLADTARNKGVYALEGEVREWLRSEIGVPAGEVVS